MKKRWQWFKSTVRYLGLALFIPGLVYAQQQPAGVVTGLQGQAQLTRAAAQTPLRFKDGVVIRDIVDTREKSLARILFGGRSTVTVRELTRLEVREEILPTGVRRDVYDLSSGAILVNVARQLMRPGDEVIIRTPNSIASVRGSTIFCQCILVPVIQCNLALLFGSAVVTPEGRPPVTLTPNTGLNVAGTGPAVQATQVAIPQSQANQILAESQVGKVVREEANQGQIAQSQTQIATELATAVVDAFVKGAAIEPTTGGGQQGGGGDDKGKPIQGCTTNCGGSEPEPKANERVVVKNETRTLHGEETLKTISGESSLSGSDPVVTIENSTVNRASTGNLIQVNSEANATIEGSLLRITNDESKSEKSTITDSRILEVRGSLKNTSTETLITIDPTTINTPGDFMTIGPGGSLTTEGQLVTDVGGTFNVGGDYLKIFDGGKLTSNTTSSVFDFDGSEVNVGSDGGDTHFTRVTGASSEATTKGPLVKAKDTDFNIKGSAFLEVSSGGKVKSTTTSPFADLSGGSLTLGTNVRALFLGSSATLDTGGSLFKAAGTTLTAAGGVPFMQIDGSTLKVGGSILDLVNLSADLKGGLFKATDATLTPGSGVPFFKLDPSSLTVGGPFLDLTNVNLDLGNQPVARLEGGSTLKNTAGPVFKISGGSLKADALGTTDGAGNTFNLTGTLLDLANTTVTLRTLGESPDGDTDTVTFNLAANEPFIKMTNSTLKLTGTGDNTEDNTLIGLEPDQTGATFKGVGLIATGSTLILPDGLLEMEGVFNSTSTSPILQFTNSTVDNTSDLITVEPSNGSPTNVTLAGQLVKSSGSTFKVKNKDVNTVNKTVGVGTKPFDVAFAGDRAYVVNFNSGTVSVINLMTKVIEKTLSVGSFPTSIARDSSVIYVVNAGDNTVSRIDPITNTVTATISVGAEPHGVTILPNDDVAYVTNFAGNTVSVIRTSDNTVTKTIAVGSGPEGIGFTPDGKKVGVLNKNGGTVSVIDTSNDTVVATITVGTKPVDAATTLNTNRAYVINEGSDNVSVINTTTNTVVATVAVGDGPHAVAITPNDKKAYVANELSNNVSVIDTSNNTVIATIAVGTEPGSIAISPDGKRAYVANFGSNKVSVIDTENDTVIATVNVGTGPGTIALTRGGTIAFVLNENSNNVSVVDTIDVGNFLAIIGGAKLKSTSTLPLLEFNPSTVELGGRLVNIRDSSSKLDLAGPLVKATDTDFTIRGILRVRDGGVLTSSTTESLMKFVGTAADKSKVDTLSDSIAIDQQDTTDKAPQVTLAGPLLQATKTTFTAGKDSINKNVFILVADGGLLKSTGTDPLITFDGSTLDPSQRFLGVWSPDAAGTDAKVQVAGPLLEAKNSSSFKTGGDFITIEDKATLKGTGTTPLVQSENSTFNIGSELQGFGSFLRLDDNTTVSQKGPATVELAGPLISDSNSTFDIFDRFLSVRDGSTFTSTSTDYLLQFSGSTVDTGLNFLSITSSSGQAPSMTLSGGLLAATNTDFTAGDSENRNSFLFVGDSAKLKSTGADPLVTFDTSTLDTGGNFLTIRRSGATPSTVEIAGPLLKATDSDFTTADTLSFLFLGEGGELKGTGTQPLFQFTDSSFDVGSDFVTLAAGAPGPSVMDLKGALVSDSDSTFTIGNRFLRVRDGSTLTSTTTDPLIQFSGSTVDTKDDFLRLEGSGSKIDIKGSFLNAGSTLNIGTDPARFGDLVDIRDGGQLVMNSSNPVVLFTGGTHTVGTDDTTSNNTPNRLFFLRGVNTDSDGLGSDQPIKGTNPPFEGADNPIGILLKATDGATIEVKKGSGDAAGGNAVRLDTARYEGAPPIIELTGSATNETTLTTADSTLSFFKSKIVSLGPVVAMDKSFINVTNGPFIILTSGSEWKVKGDFLKLFNGSKIEVINGPLILVQGKSSTGKVSLLEVSGALVEFGGSGNNKIIVNNSITVTDTKNGIKVNESSGGTVLIGPNPIKNSSLGSITQNGVLIQATNNGKVDIKAPGSAGPTQTVDFNAGSGSPLSYTEKGVTFKSLQDHLHLGDNNGDGSPDLLNHSSCCSTPYRITHQGGTFDLVSIDLKQCDSCNSTFTNDKDVESVVINTSTPLGTFEFPSADWSKIEFAEWDETGSQLIIDDLVFRPNPDPPLYLVRDGEKLVGPSLRPLVEFSDQSLTFDSVLVACCPGLNGPSSVSLSGPLLKAERSELTVPFSLLGLYEGSTLTTTSSDPLVWLQGGNYSLSTLKGTAIFDIWGTETARDPETGVRVGTAKTLQHAGPLLEASGGATVNTQKVLRLDTALLEATAPIISLIGSANKQTELTTATSTMDLMRSQVVSTGPVVAMDKSFINVTNGALINLTHGSNMKVTGDLISMLSGSKINVVNGPLINAAGAGSLLEVSGALVNFGGTGGNKIIVNNTITPTATLSGLPVSATFGGAINIGPNPVKNPSLGNISVTGSLISATNGGKINIKAP